MPAQWEIADSAAAARKRLLRAGFNPIPANGKAPPPGWDKMITATEADIDQWFSRFQDSTNTGVLTRMTPAADIDVYDGDVADEIEQALWDMIGERTMVRFGLPPKRAALFKADVPFKKITTPFFISPGGQKPHKVEVLCDGQQLIVAGIHPDTGKPYSWHGGEPGEVRREDLPELTQAMAQAFIDKAAAIMRVQGWIEQPRKAVNGHDAAIKTGFDAATFNAIYGSRGQKYAHAALAGRAAELARIPQGERNNELNASAFRLGTMSARGWIGRDEVERGLFAAAITCGLVAEDGEAAVRATIASGIGSGELIPHADLDAAAAETPPPPLQFADISQWRVDRGVPERQWGVRNLFPRRNVALLSGEGAAGKSLLALQLGVAHALGRDWIGTLPEQGSFLYLGAEDDVDELHRRLADVLRSYDTDFPAISSNVHLLSLAGEDAVLGHADAGGLIKPTPLYLRLMQAATEIKPMLIALDTSADVYAGSEIDRTQVRQFIGLLRRLAMTADGYVLMCSHPSLTGINSGSGLSGSTAWHNSVKARAYLLTPKTEGDQDPGAESPLRELQFRKSNYGPISRSITLRWDQGVYKPVGGAGLLDKLAREQTAEKLFLALLDRFNAQGRHVTQKEAAKNYAPNAFAKEADTKAQGFRKADLEAAMRRLFDKSQIAVQPYGPPSRGTTCLVAR
jgi:RecA-family ATPase